MSPDAFRRLALLALCTAYVAGLGALGLYVDVVLAFCALVFGAVLATALTIEPTASADAER